MFIEIDEFFCIDTTKINCFKQFQDKLEGQLCIIYTNEFSDGLRFKDKDGELYNSLKKIFNTCDALHPNIIKQPIIFDDDEKVKW